MTTNGTGPGPEIAGLDGFVQEARNGLGALCWWDLYGTKIRPAALRGILDREGLSIDVPDPDPATEARRAARAWKSKDDDGRRYRGEVVKIEDSDVVKVCLQRRRVRGQGRSKALDWRTVDSVVLDTTTRRWTVSADTAMVRAFVAMADGMIEFLDHTFIRPNVIHRELSRLRAFSVKASSGIWYVPQAAMSDLGALQRVVRAIGSSDLHCVNLLPTSSTRYAVVSGVQTEIRSELSTLEDKLEDWQASTRKIRTDAIASTLARYTDLAERASLYADSLQIRLDDISVAIEASRARARELIDGNIDAHSNPNTKPLGVGALRTLGVARNLYARRGAFTLDDLENEVTIQSETLAMYLRKLERRGEIRREGKTEDGNVLWCAGSMVESTPAPSA